MLFAQHKDIHSPSLPGQRVRCGLHAQCAEKERESGEGATNECEDVLRTRYDPEEPFFEQKVDSVPMFV